MAIEIKKPAYIQAPHGDRQRDVPAATPPYAAPIALARQPGMAAPERPANPTVPGHPAHTMYLHTTELFRALCASQNITLTSEQHENVVAAIMLNCVKRRMTDVTRMEFARDPKTGQMDLNQVLAFQDESDPADGKGRFH